MLLRWCMGALVCAGLLGCDDAPKCGDRSLQFCGEALASDATASTCDKTSVRDVRALACAPRLERVSLTGTSVSDIASLAKLTKLRSLELARTKVKTLLPVASHPDLERVDLRWVDVELTPLANTPKLSMLKIGGAHLKSLAVVEPLVQLKQLHVEEVPVTEATPLTKLTKLESLALHVTKIRDLSPLAKLPELQRLSITDSPVATLAPLEKCRRLRTVDLDHTEVTAQEVARFKKAKPAIRVISYP